MTAAPVFTFDETLHEYRVDNVVYPSITQVIEAAGLVDFSAIPLAELEFYKGRGSALHAAAWYSDEGDLNESTVDPQVAPRLAFWKQFRQDLPFKVTAMEFPRYDRVYRYAGTPDRLVEFPDGTCGLIELKSGPLQPAVAIQLAGQANLLEPLGGRLRRIAVHLGVDRYSAREFPLSSMRADLSVFLSSVTLFNWKRGNL